MEKEKTQKTQEVTVIDGSGLLLGRLASQVAKMALLGKRVVIINSEKVVVSGSKETLLAKFKPRRAIGKPFHGPYTPTMPDRMVRRAIRGMLPRRKVRGMEAYRRVLCYVGLPEEYQNIEAQTIESALAETKVKTGHTMTIGAIASLVGKYNK